MTDEERRTAELARTGASLFSGLSEPKFHGWYSWKGKWVGWFEESRTFVWVKGSEWGMGNDA